MLLESHAWFQELSEAQKAEGRENSTEMHLSLPGATAHCLD